ncbi:MAG: DUF1460 domain-containing protein [Gemmatimonadetes bacterium]|nr:DUF1460 domain-containing protein [Gemmatimonadota bacterium]
MAENELAKTSGRRSRRGLGRVKVGLFMAAITIGIAALVSTIAQPTTLDAEGLGGPMAGPGSTAPGEARADRSWTAEDWDVFADKVRFATRPEIVSLPLGDAIAELALSFIGTPYVPGTLETEGAERLVIDFRGLDCVTFVENVLAITRFARTEGRGLLEDAPAAEARYERILTAIRYRDGTLDGYPSRLHYFSEWLDDNARRGLIEVVTRDLEPSTDEEPITFMTSHPDAYRQLSDPDVLAAIEDMEARLNRDPARPFVPQDRIADIAARIESGDVIAATSALTGLDVAHTGFAVWRAGELHLVHAPLVGRAVELSERPLADRIRSIDSQDGIMVARPRFD